MGRKRNGKTILCKACGKEFYVPKNREETAKFCSLECQNHKQYDKYVFECAGCKKTVISSPSRRNYRKKFCSLECREHLRKNDKERRLQQKLITISKRGKGSSRNLRKYLFKFKEKKCEICGYDEFVFCLDMHHVNRNPNDNRLENVKVLCCMCHKKLHKGVIQCPWSKEVEKKPSEKI